MTVLVIATVLTGCAARPTGVLQPSGKTSPEASVVDVLVATTRKPSDDKSLAFTGERADQLAITEIKVSIPPAKSRKVGQVQWPKRLPANPATDFSTVSVKSIESDEAARGWLKSHMPASRRVMIFVHGFNNTYEAAVYRFTQIVHDSGADVAPLIFTWPSRASVFDYNYDKESTNYSRDALEEVLRQTADNPAVGEITIMAHSMGSWLTVEALRQMAIRDGRVASKIKNVILASPDLDVDVFGKQWQSMGKKRPNMTIFVSRDDRALSLSRRISGNIDRLGQIDPSVEPYKSELEKSGITIIDLTALKSGDGLNHGKFAESPEVVKLIGTRLVTGQTITDSQIGVGDRIGAVAIGAAQTVGGTASILVNAPIAVFDPQTRRSYGQQIDRLGRASGNTINSVTGQ
ncbi:alpha/beta hydrolase [Agrobacterium radiobacter]|uniref:alpha/beta hydrolase n=1 Tax=Agrobacterium radiobacter TaxID=362 RepID=UPI003F83BC9C